MAGVLLSGYTAFAQDDAASEDKAAKAAAMKPEAGDIAIGVSAIPYLNYLGNFFGKQNDNDLSLGAQTLYGKYMLSSTSAIRAAVYISNSTSVDERYSQDDAALAADPTSTAQVVDSRTSKSRSMFFDLGYELRKDRDRFTFLYGANVGYGFSSFNRETSHGNPISALNPDPSSNWSGSATFGRELSLKSSTNHTVSAGIFAGIEFFIAKRFSVGADFALDYNYSWSSQSNATYEAWDGSQVYEFDRPSDPGQKSRGLSTRQYSSPTAAGAIYLLFYL